MEKRYNFNKKRKGLRKINSCNSLYLHIKPEGKLNKKARNSKTVVIKMKTINNNERQEEII